MATFPTTYTGNGVLTTFSIPWPYIDQDHVVVKVAGVTQVLGTNYTIPTAGQVAFSSAPADGAAISIDRVTPLAPLSEFTSGPLQANDLNTVTKQAQYGLQELSDSAEAAIAVRDEVLAALAGVGLPVITEDDIGRQLFVKGDASGYELLDAIPDRQNPYILVMSGQSNAAGSNARAAGGDLTANSKVFLWNGVTGAWAVWTPATTTTRYNSGAVAAIGNNNAAFSAAKLIQEQTGRDVYVILNAWPGTGIAGWWDTTEQAQLIELDDWVTAALASTELAGRTTIDAFMWAQGESDGIVVGAGSVDDRLNYRASFAGLYAALKAKSWFGEGIPMACMQLPRQASGAYSSYTWRNDLYDYLDTLGYADIGTALTKDLCADHSDGFHFDGDGLEIIGKRMVAVIAQLPRQSTRQNEDLVIEARMRIADPTGDFGFEIGSTVGSVPYIAPYDFTPGGGGDYTYWMTFDAATNAWVLPHVSLAASGVLRQGTAVKLNAIGGLILKSYLGSDFTDITHAVNTTGKVIGVTYWDSVNDRLVVAQGPAAGDAWSYFEAAGTYPPV